MKITQCLHTLSFCGHGGIYGIDRTNCFQWSRSMQGWQQYSNLGVSGYLNWSEQLAGDRPLALFPRFLTTTTSFSRLLSPHFIIYSKNLEQVVQRLLTSAMSGFKYFIVVGDAQYPPLSLHFESFASLLFWWSTLPRRTWILVRSEPLLDALWFYYIITKCLY